MNTMNEQKTKSKSTGIFLSVGIICLMVIGYFLISSGSDASDLVKTSPVSKMQKLTHKVQGLETDVKKKQGEVMVLADQYKEKTGKELPFTISTLNLNEAEKKILEEQFNGEKNLSAKGLLQEILKRQQDIRDLQDKIAQIEYQLPMPIIAKKGDNHYDIALSFLVDSKALDEKDAIKLLSKVALFDQLAEGFKVWNFYDGVEFGTSVTQGEAKVTPNSFINRGKKLLKEERDQAVLERDAMVENLKNLEVNQEEISTQLDMATQENEILCAQVSDLNKQVNSVYYNLDLKKNLKKKGILKGGVFGTAKLKDVSPVNFNQTLDLNSEDYLIISALDLGVKQINDVELFPRFYKKGKNYKLHVTPSKKHALLTLLDKNQFKSERIIIAVK